ncbi:MAG: MFS transporter [Deltaproteobacteria bacterium]|nr:MFS transporter [Deltaproteobacteria bacterium]
MSKAARTAAVAWLVTAVYYFYQYSLRSAPAVMMPQLSEAFGLNAMGVASMVGLFYWGYSPFSLVAGAAMDRLGPRKVVPIGAAMVGIGALLFSTGNATAASAGRVLQELAGCSRWWARCTSPPPASPRRSRRRSSARPRCSGWRADPRASSWWGRRSPPASCGIGSGSAWASPAWSSACCSSSCCPSRNAPRSAPTG